MEETGTSVLVIEDDTYVNEVISKVLIGSGFEPRSAFNGQAGLDSFRMNPTDLVILDINMPVMDGWEVLARLRETSHVPVIILTAYSGSENVIKGLDLGADDYLVKPFGVKELVARVQAVMRRPCLRY